MSGNIVGRSYGFIKQPASDAAYAAHHLTPGQHVLLDFDQRRPVSFVGMPKARFPDPKGISGAPLWILRFHDDGQLSSRVVGVAIEHRSNLRHKVVVCARIESVMHMINSFEAALTARGDG